MTDSTETRKVWQPGTVYEFGAVVEPRVWTGFYYKAELIDGWTPPTVPEGEPVPATPTYGTSWPKEPSWPTVADGVVVDNGATATPTVLQWRAYEMDTVRWQCKRMYSSGPSDVVAWPTTPGDTVLDGDLTWTCESPAVADEKCPDAAFALIASSHVFAPYSDVVRFSAVNNPLDWQSEQDAGFLPTGMQSAADAEVRALGMYRGNLVAWTNTCMQVWQVDPDPQRMALLDVIEGIGCRWPESVAAMQSDLFFLTDLGVRSVSVAAGQGSLAAGDVGTPIDALIQAILREPLARDPFGLYVPNLGQYWLIFGDFAYVLTLTPSSGVVAWSRYSFPWAVLDAVIHDGRLHVSTSAAVFELDPTALVDDLESGTDTAAIPVSVQWPWLDFGMPGADKRFTGFDVVASSPCSVSFGYDEHQTSRFTNPISAPATSRVGGFLPLHVACPSLSVRVTHNGKSEWELSQVTLYMQGASGPQ